MHANRTQARDLLSTRQQDDHVFVSGWLRTSPLLIPCSFMGGTTRRLVRYRAALHPVRRPARPFDPERQRPLSRRTSMRGTARTVAVVAGVSTLTLLAAACGGGN